MSRAAQAPKRPTDALVQAHEAHSSIRAQGKRAAALPVNSMAGLNKDVVKAVLASPLIVPWPTVPTYLQTSVLRTLVSLIPAAVADYHVGRARCQRSHKREKRKQVRAEKRVEDGSGVIAQQQRPQETLLASASAMDVDTPVSVADAKTAAPTRPDELKDLTIGITEITKHLEAQTAALRLRIQSLSTTQLPGNLLPTAPVSELTPESENPFLPAAAHHSPLRFVICPLTDINPPTLVAHVPQYCATYNALVRQWNGSAKPEADVQEVTLVTTAKGSEMTLAELVGLRRVACLGLTTTYPGLAETLVTLLPTSTLVPPRHVFTLPAPIPGQAQGSPAAYIPLHLKAIHTTMPANSKEKKQARLEAVRAKRKANKVQGETSKRKGKGPKAKV